jgi:hypothetical protein
MPLVFAQRRTHKRRFSKVRWLHEVEDSSECHSQRTNQRR